jgi:hypothetical protein
VSLPSKQPPIRVTCPATVALTLHYSVARHLSALPLQNGGTGLFLLRDLLIAEAQHLGRHPKSPEDAYKELKNILFRLDSRTEFNSTNTYSQVIDFLKAFINQCDIKKIENVHSELCCLAPLLHLIEQNVRYAYKVHAKTLHAQISYHITLKPPPDNQVTRPTLPLISAVTSIDLTPRHVEIELWNELMTGEHLTQLVYTVFHELTCHGFQAANAACLSNAPPNCLWTEGWMDIVATEMAKDWITTNDAKEWLPDIESKTIRVINRAHDERFGPSLATAETAYERLDKLLKLYDSQATSSKLDIRNFSIAVNVNDEATSEILTDLVVSLMAIQASDQNVQADESIVKLCQNYMSQSSLSVLIEEIKALGLNGPF